MIKRHSNLVHSAYFDLKRIVKDEEISDLRGGIDLMKRGDKTYIFDKYRIGDKDVRRYLGPLDVEMQQRIDRYREIKAERETRHQERLRLVRLLRGEGVTGVDAPTGKLLRAFERTGAFRLGAVLVGTAAFSLYESELGIRLDVDDTTRTLDIDLASFRRLAIGIDEMVEPSLADTFKDLKFEPVPGLGRQSWRWKQVRGETLVEFLTPYTTGSTEQEMIAALGIEARTIRFMEYLLSDTIDAVAIYRNGILVRIPSPQRYAVHKLIVAARRIGGDDAIKAEKDRQQARLLINVLADDRPHELAEAFNVAVNTGEQWREAIETTVRKMPDVKERLADIV